MPASRPEALPAPCGRVIEAVAIALLGKLADVAIERWKAHAPLADRLKALEAELATLKQKEEAAQS